MTKDYYKILGVTEFDTAENIKSAYRKLARKWHPDVAGDTAEVMLKFKEINEAYEILSDKVKKADYDRARRFYSYAKDGASDTQKTAEKTTTNPSYKTSGTKDKTFSFDWKEFVSKYGFEFNFKKEEKPLPKRGKDVNTTVEITVIEAIQGTNKVINMIQTGVCPKCGGRKFVNGGICHHCNGKGEISNYKKFNVKIPAGVKDGSKIRLAGEGEYGINGGENGDLYVTITVKSSQEYATDGLNILKTIPITPFEAVLGAEINIKTINGDYSFNIAPDTQNGQKIRLAGCGIVQNDKVGDMIITVEIKIPRNLSIEERNLYQKLKEISSNNVRESITD